jgi:hypothetical protein
MTAIVEAPVLGSLEAELDALLTTDLSARSGSEIVAILGELACTRARLDAFEGRVIAEAQRQHVAFAHGATSVADLVAGVSRCSRGEARAKVRRSVDLAPRTTLTGEPLEPVHPHTAAAFEAGAISAAHADAIVESLGRIPATCPPTTSPWPSGAWSTSPATNPRSPCAGPGRSCSPASTPTAPNPATRRSPAPAASDSATTPTGRKPRTAR